MVGRDEFEQTSSKCRVVFRVGVSREAENEELEEYFCPEFFVCTK